MAEATPGPSCLKKKKRSSPLTISHLTPAQKLRLKVNTLTVLSFVFQFSVKMNLNKTETQIEG
jgi:hypothetical protein